MPRWAPCKRREFLRKLRVLGFTGPYTGGRHEFLVFGGHRLAVPSNEEFSVPQLRMMLREVAAIAGAEVRLEDWGVL